MKKFIAIIAAAVMLLCTAACSSLPEPGEVEQSPETIAQMEIISSFGITLKDSRIVASQDQNDYVKYVVVNYEDGVKKSEQTYYFYNNDTAYALAKKEKAEEKNITFVDESRYTVQDSGTANTGSYDGDYMLLGKDHIFR